MQHEFVFAGFGGQGVMFAGQLLAHAALDAGLEVTWFPSYGPEMRGGTAHCFVVVSDEPIGSPVVKQPKNAVIFNSPSFDKYEPLLAPEGLLVVNASLVDSQSQRTDITQLIIPATELADKIGDLKLANMVLIGALLTARSIIPLEAIRAALDTYVPAHHRDKLPLNLKAIDQGVVYASRLLQRI